MKERTKIGISEYNELIDFSNTKLTPLQAIKLKCKECCAFYWNEAKRCDIKTCALNQFITKKNTYTITEEERERRRNIFKK